jgi:hypothetical protein
MRATIESDVNRALKRLRYVQTFFTKIWPFVGSVLCALDKTMLCVNFFFFFYIVGCDHCMQQPLWTVTWPWIVELARWSGECRNLILCPYRLAALTFLPLWLCERVSTANEVWDLTILTFCIKISYKNYYPHVFCTKKRLPCQRLFFFFFNNMIYFSPVDRFILLTEKCFYCLCV